MPTLFRLLSFIAVVAALVYGGMLAVVTLVKPSPREIVQAVALPNDAAGAGTAASGDVHTGRSVAYTLNKQAEALVRHHPHRRQAASE